MSKFTERLDKMDDRLNAEGRYTDANMVWVAKTRIEELEEAMRKLEDASQALLKDWDSHVGESTEATAILDVALIRCWRVRNEEKKPSREGSKVSTSRAKEAARQD